MKRPPPAAQLRAEAVVESFAAGAELTRAHSHAFGSIQFDARSGADSRFSTVRHGGTVLPVVYAGEDDVAAASESIFHTVPGPTGDVRPRRVPLARYQTWHWSTVTTTRDIDVVRLDADGLDALGLTRAEMIEGGQATYVETRQWAEAVLTALPDVDGLWWHSRQAPTRRAIALYEQIAGRAGGLGPGDLEATGPVLPFASVDGLAQLDQIGLDLGITITRP